MTRLGVATMGWMVALAASACSDDGVPASESEGTGTLTTSEGTSAETGTTLSTSATITSAEESSSATTTETATSSESSGGSSSEGSSSESGGMPTTCTTDDDCVLVEDCCTCGAIVLGRDAPECAQPECDQTACMAAGLRSPGVHCELGFCMLDETVECNPAGILCDSTPPQCEEGLVPSVEGDCWTGNCVPIDACRSLGSCEGCPADRTCVELQAFTSTFECSPIPAGCNGTPSCACMGEVCEAPYTSCNDVRGGLVCGCPTC